MIVLKTLVNISFQTNVKFVMPAKAGIQVHPRFHYKPAWIPASAGMTEGESAVIGTSCRRAGLSSTARKH